MDQELATDNDSDSSVALLTDEPSIDTPRPMRGLIAPLRLMLFGTNEHGMPVAFEVRSHKITQAAVEQLLQDSPREVWTGQLIGKLRRLQDGEMEKLLGVSLNAPPEPVI